MSKKLEELLEAIEGGYNSYELADAYQAYMEERKTIPQQGDLIEVRNSEKGEWIIKKFISFANGLVIADDDPQRGGKTPERCANVGEYFKQQLKYINYWKYYRIPTPKKKWKVVKDGIAFIVVEFDHPTDLPIITTFED